MKLLKYIFYLVCLFLVISIICTICLPTWFNFICNILCFLNCIICYFNWKSTTL